MPEPHIYAGILLIALGASVAVLGWLIRRASGKRYQVVTPMLATCGVGLVAYGTLIMATGRSDIGRWLVVPIGAAILDVVLVKLAPRPRR